MSFDPRHVLLQSENVCELRGITIKFTASCIENAIDVTIRVSFAH